MEEKEYVQQLRDGRVFFDYGPVSMVVSALRGGRPDTALCRSAFSVIERCLCELSPQLEMLRRYPPEVETDRLSGAALIMAQAMLDAADPWLTPMAAVAGTLSDAVADYLWDQGAEKVIVNNGGDIALRLAPGQRLGLGVRYDLSRDSIDRVIHLDRDTKVGGVATSGLGGRSLTTGIASGVTVFASRCAMADALATLLADRSYLELPAVHTRPAEEIDPDTDIAGQKVVVKVDPLTREQRRKALAQILDEAQRQYCRGHLIACIATVQGESASFDPADILKS